MHHALMNLCEPVLERAAIFDSYACRQGKGQLAAVRRADSYARRYGWCSEWVAGRWTELQLQQRMQALVAFTLPARSRPWRRHVLHRFACLPRDKEVRIGTQCARRRQGVVVNGLEPRDPRRQLEQQRQELPVSEPQQQQPGQQEQQYWAG